MSEFGKFKDERDGTVYKTVKIGNQVWFAENFRYDCAGSMVYMNKTKNLKRYGRLYTWHSAMNATPDGWRLPSLDDWNKLINSGGRLLSAMPFSATQGGVAYDDGTFFYEGRYGNWWASSQQSNRDAWHAEMNPKLSTNMDYNDKYKCLNSVRYLKN